MIMAKDRSTISATMCPGPTPSALSTMRQLIDLVIELRVGERRRAEHVVVVADHRRAPRMRLDLRLDQFLQRDVYRETARRSD